MIRIEKIIDIIRENINVHGLHLDFSTVEGLIWKIYFLEFLELFFNREM
jgi:hypothetical protein